MILSFKEQFKNKIISSEKTQTIRLDNANRWKPKRMIQFWIGNPRNKKSYQFGYGYCTQTFFLKIDFQKDNIELITRDAKFTNIDNIDELNKFAVLDGFENWQELKEFFNCDIFFGKLIYFDFINTII
jgi:hypothetical protein